MKHFLLAILFLIVNHITYAQTPKPGSDIIVSTKTVYMHYQDQKDSLMFPEVSAQYPVLKEALSPKNLLQGDNLEDVVANYQKCGCGITGLSYSIGFVNADVISIEIYYITKLTRQETDAILPQEAEDHEPNRVLLIPYAQLKPYIKTGSIVLKGIRK